MDQVSNPFQGDADRSAIWDMLVRRDIAAFVAADWGMVAEDFDEDRFLGIHAHFSADPDHWTAAFTTIDSYRDEWLRQEADSADTDYAEPLAPAILRSTDLSSIDVDGDIAVARKKFDGTIEKADGNADRLNWQTLYFCRRVRGRWKITGFVGYLKHLDH